LLVAINIGIRRVPLAANVQNVEVLADLGRNISYMRVYFFGTASPAENYERGAHIQLEVGARFAAVPVEKAVSHGRTRAYAPVKLFSRRGEGGQYFIAFFSNKFVCKPRAYVRFVGYYGDISLFGGKRGRNAGVPALAEYEVGLYVVDNSARFFHAFEKSERQKQVAENFSAHQLHGGTLVVFNVVFRANPLFYAVRAEIAKLVNVLKAFDNGDIGNDVAGTSAAAEHNFFHIINILFIIAPNYVRGGQAEFKIGNSD